MLKRVLTAVVLVPIVLLIVFRAPIWVFAVVVGLIALQTTREYLDIVEAHAIKPARTLTYVFAIVVFASWVGLLLVEWWINPSQTSRRNFDLVQHPYLALAYRLFAAGVTTLFFGAIAFLVAMFRREDLRSALPSAASSLLGLNYVVWPLVGVVAIRNRAGGAFYVFYLLIVVWAGDILAFFVGRRWGRRKLAPRISPNKSWEGAVASFLAATSLGTLVLFKSDPIVDFLHDVLRLLVPVRGNVFASVLHPYHAPLWVCVLLSATLNVAAQLGDLAESMLKRGAGVKDSGAILPGHGGMLDRIDALLFAAPVLWYYTTTLSGIHMP